MTIHSEVREEMEDAIRLRDRERLLALRNMIAEFKNEIIKDKSDRDADISEEKAVEVIVRLVKQRRDSIEQFEKAGRKDLVNTERIELSVLEKYLPEQMTDKEIRKYLKEKIKEMKIADKTKVGQLIGTSMKDLKGKVDGRAVKRIVEELL